MNRPLVLSRWLKKAFILVLTGTISLFSSAQSTDLGLEIQAYPTGVLSGVRADFGFGERQALHVRLGYNLVRHRDLGEHEDERGGGFGFSLGYKRYFSADFRRWFLGLRSDLWFNDVDWKDNIGMLNEVSGNTKITVLQPTLEGGFAFEFGEGQWFFTPSLAFGYEINVKTEGAEVGQGAILLAGFSIGRRFGK